jgi:hypothetical protein
MEVPPDVAAAMDRLRKMRGVGRLAAAPEGKVWVITVFSRRSLADHARWRIAAATGAIRVRFEVQGAFDLSVARPAFPEGARKRKKRR